MSAQNNEVNRNIDTETTEGHRLAPRLEEGEDPGKRVASRKNDALDDEAEGHRLAPR